MVISNTGHCSIHCNCHWVQPCMYTASTQFSKKSEKLSLMPQSQVMHGAGGNGVTSCQKNEYFIYKLKQGMREKCACVGGVCVWAAWAGERWWAGCMGGVRGQFGRVAWAGSMHGQHGV